MLFEFSIRYLLLDCWVVVQWKFSCGSWHRVCCGGRSRILGSSWCESQSRRIFLPSAVRPDFSHTMNSERAERMRDLFAEKNSYQLARSHTPDWTECVESMWSSTALDVFGIQFPMMIGASGCKPEISVRCKRPRVPGFNAEMKTMGNNGLFDGAVTYVLFDMLRSFFTDWRPGEAQPRAPSTSLFYERPPLGYALCGAPPLGWVVVMELIGRVHVSTYSEPYCTRGRERRRNRPRPRCRAAFSKP